MHSFLRNALKDVIARCERPDAHRSDERAARDRETATAARKLLLHDSPNDAVERWLDNHPDPDVTPEVR